MRIFLVTAVVLLSIHISSAGTFSLDSIGLERIDGNVYILHRVEEKETLYSLSKRYRVEIDDIIAINPSSEFGLNIGEILKVPVAVKTVPAEDGRITHKVQPKETLYSISKKYEVTPEDIKKWNRISTNILDIGQELIIYPTSANAAPSSVPAVVETPKSDQKLLSNRVEGYSYHIVREGETLYSLSRKYEVPLEDLREWNDLRVNDIAIGQELIIGKGKPKAAVETSEEPENVQKAEQVAKENNPNEQKEPSEPVGVPVKDVIYADAGAPLARENTNFDEIVESGLAEVIEGSSNNRKYLALHRTAKVGTIMRIRNEMNGQEVFVRIIGKLPDTGANRNILLKISRAAYEQLGAIDDKFRVTISFMP